jgi:hypothetical protein
MPSRFTTRLHLLTGLSTAWFAVVALSATPTIPYDAGDPTGDEQYMLELINRARLGPAQEGIFLTTQTETDIVQAYTFFSVNKPAIVSAFSIIPSAQPLAMNPILLGTARAQSIDQMTFHYQGHTSHDGRAFNVRINQAGYVNAALAENVFAPIAGPIATTLYGHVGFNIDWGVPSLDHRKTIMGINDTSAGFDYGTLREVGIGLVQVTDARAFDGTSWYITQDFGVVYDTSSGSFGPTINKYLVGVVYLDRDGDGFYTPGEGAAGVTVMPDVGTDYAITSTSGGYSIPLLGLPGGTTSVTVTFSGGVLGTQMLVRTISFNGTRNLKADVVPLITTPQAVPSGNNIVLQFLSVIGQRYRVEQTSDLTTWTPLQDNIAGNGAAIQVTHTNGLSLGKQFYRVLVL